MDFSIICCQTIASYIDKIDRLINSNIHAIYLIGKLNYTQLATLKTNNSKNILLTVTIVCMTEAKAPIIGTSCKKNNKTHTFMEVPITKMRSSK